VDKELEHLGVTQCDVTYVSKSRESVEKRTRKVTRIRGTQKLVPKWVYEGRNRNRAEKFSKVREGNDSSEGRMNTLSSGLVKREEEKVDTGGGPYSRERERPRRGRRHPSYN